MSGSISKTIYSYAGFLLLCGVLGFAMAGFDSKAKSSLFMGGGSAAAVAACAYLIRNQQLRVAEKAFKAAIALPIIFAGTFVWRASKIVDAPHKQYLFYLLSFMALGSVFFAYQIYQSKSLKKILK